ncbi:DoxX family protein [Streptomyces sp. NPDC087420]|uniref:DoxX family protein n=1 Tax=Streptomyces sp. NPDC087420 TaxID=3365785 RepID=UPI003838D394
MSLINRKDLGLLAVRLGTGSVLAAHGSQKLFGWFGGAGIEGTAKGMEQMGFRPGRQSAIASGLGEVGGGVLLALGLATPMAGAAAAGAMAGAASVHVPSGFFAHQGGVEHPAFLGYVAASLGLAGPGRYSLDHFTSHKLDRPLFLLLAFTASAAAATAVVGRRTAALAAERLDADEDADADADGGRP